MAHSCTDVVWDWDWANRQWDGRFRRVKCTIRLQASSATQRGSQSLGTLDCLSPLALPQSVFRPSSPLLRKTNSGLLNVVPRLPRCWLLGLGDGEKLGRG